MGDLGALAPAGLQSDGSVGIEVGMAVVVGAAETVGDRVGRSVVGAALGGFEGVVVGVAVVGTAVGFDVGDVAVSQRRRKNKKQNCTREKKLPHTTYSGTACCQ